MLQGFIIELEAEQIPTLTHREKQNICELADSLRLRCEDVLEHYFDSVIDGYAKDAGQYKCLASYHAGVIFAALHKKKFLEVYLDLKKKSDEQIKNDFDIALQNSPLVDRLKQKIILEKNQINEWVKNDVSPSIFYEIHRVIQQLYGHYSSGTTLFYVDNGEARASRELVQDILKNSYKYALVIMDVKC